MAEDWLNRKETERERTSRIDSLLGLMCEQIEQGEAFSQNEIAEFCGVNQCFISRTEKSAIAKINKLIKNVNLNAIRKASMDTSSNT